LFNLWSFIDETCSFSLADLIELSFLLVKVTEGQVKDCAADPSEDAESSKEITETILHVEGHEGEVQCGRDSSLELSKGHDNGLHALRRLGKGIFQRGDTGEDLGNGDKDIWSRHDPDVDWSRVWVAIFLLTC